MELKKLVSWVIPSKLKNRLYTFFIQQRTIPINFTKINDCEIPSEYVHHVALDNDLVLLGEKYKPTKRLHNYLPHYWKHFRDIRYKVTRVLEIGVQSDKSIRMWEEFFPNAVIYGIDIEGHCKEYEGGRRKIFIGDQSDAVFLNTVVSNAGGAFDIIIDDGSHRVYHQLKTFSVLFPKLKSHGIYVIEDTGACVGDTSLKTISAIKKLIGKIMYFPKGLAFDKWSSLKNFENDSDWASQNIVGIAFYRWICFIERGKNPSDNPYLISGEAAK